MRIPTVSQLCDTSTLVVVESQKKKRRAKIVEMEKKNKTVELYYASRVSFFAIGQEVGACVFSFCPSVDRGTCSFIL